MKTKILYIKKCFLCGELYKYVLRDENVNPMSDKDAETAIGNVKDRKPDFDWCEKCKLSTKQEIVAFEY